MCKKLHFFESPKGWSLTIKEGGHQKPDPCSELLFLKNFLCALPFTQFVGNLYVGVVEGSIFPFKSQCTVCFRLLLRGPMSLWQQLLPGDLMGTS